MQPQTKKCRNCGFNFQIMEADFEMYEKLQVPPPTFCNNCRQARRLAWRNERWMFKRKCDFSNKNIISMYPPDSPFKIYDQEIWWSDKWNAEEYGRDYDFSRPFFEQFRELQLAVPRVALVNKRSENSEYTNHSSDNKNCYMSAVVFNSEDCLYSDWIIHSRDSIDCSYLVENCELAYETYYAWNSYKTAFCDFIRQCCDVWFCYDCFNTKNCFMCSNLRNKEYCIRNKQYSKEEYQKELLKMFPLKYDDLKKLREEYIKIKNEVAIRPATYEVNAENPVGDLLFESKNCYFAFDCIKVEDCRYIYDAIDIKDSMDVYHVGWAQLMYECHAISNAYNCRFCHFTYDNINCTYCDCTQNSKNLFGCVCMNRAQYCILNKQYTKEAFGKLRLTIIEHMRNTGEYGEFFPIAFSPFAYNQSRVQEYFPLDKKSAEAKGYRWSDFKPDPIDATQKIEASALPQTIEDVNENILEKVIVCEATKRPFKILKNELRFYKKFGLPLPRRHPDQRYLDRMAQRVPRQLWQRSCVKCGEKMWSSHNVNTKAKAYCKKCYLEEVY